MRAEVRSRGLAPAEYVGADKNSVNAEHLFDLDGHLCGEAAITRLQHLHHLARDAEGPSDFTLGEPLFLPV